MKLRSLLSVISNEAYVAVEFEDSLRSYGYPCNLLSALDEDELNFEVYAAFGGNECDYDLLLFVR